MNHSAFNFASGMSIGYLYSSLKREENAIKQGKNYYLACFNTFFQLSLATSVADKITALAPFSSHLFNASLIICPLAASVKEGDFPKKLGDRSIKVFHFIAEHSGDMARVVMVASSVALIALGNPCFGGTILLNIAYQSADSMGYVPTKVSLFVESFMPVVSNMMLLVIGTPFEKVLSVINLAELVANPEMGLMHAINKKIDGALARFHKSETIHLKDIETPLSNRKNIDQREIQAVLNTWRFKVDIPHCSKPAFLQSSVEKDHDFDFLLNRFDQVSWKEQLLSLKLSNDDRFQDFIADHKEANLLNYTRKEIQLFVSVLKREKKVGGSEIELEKTIETFAAIIPYLKKMTDPVELEDILLKIAIEAGGYCGPGLKRTGTEILRQVSKNGSYEELLREKLEALRLRISQAAYDDVTSIMLNRKFSHDTHVYNSVAGFFQLGFLPYPKAKVETLFPGFILSWNLIKHQHLNLLTRYQKEMMGVFKELGAVNFAPFFMELIEENQLLTEEQKEEIIGDFAEPGVDMERYYALTLYMLGILKTATPLALSRERNERPLKTLPGMRLSPRM